MKMSKGWEGSSSESIQLVSKNFNLLGLLLGNIQELSLVSNLLDLLAWISVPIVHSVGLETHDLLSLVDIVLQLSCFSLKLLRL